MFSIRSAHFSGDIMDTANDFRILLAEKGVNELNRIANSLKVPGRKKFVSLLNTLSSEIQNIKYCYLSPADILDFESFKNAVNLAKNMREMLPEEKSFNEITADYWLEYIQSLPELMKRGEISKAYEAIKFFSGEIVSKNKADNLWFCIVDCGRRFEVITNSAELASRDTVVVSYLPPRKFGEFVSRGMFVDASFAKKGELSIEEIRSLTEKLGEVEAVLVELLRF